MKVGLISDSTDKFPSLPLMKISSYHKRRGDVVEFAKTALFAHYDVIYVSRVFHLQLKGVPCIQTDYLSADRFVFGGTGYCIEVINGREVFHKERDVWLSDEIEHSYPDYSLYPTLTKNKAYGFLTRGCPNQCPFCIISQHEGVKSQRCSEPREWWNGQKNIVLMDANLLACKEREYLLMQLIESGASVDYTQGLDARFIDDDMAKLVCQTRIKMVHFAFDLVKNEKEILSGLATFRKHFDRKDDRSCKVYILTNYNTTFEEDYMRVKKVMELGYSPDVRIYQKGTEPQITRDLARWANNQRIYRSCDFLDYVPRADGRTIKQLYGLNETQYVPLHLERGKRIGGCEER